MLHFESDVRCWYSKKVNSTYFGVRKISVKCWFHYSTAPWLLWSLSLNFLLYKMGTLFLRVIVVRLKWGHACGVLSRVSSAMVNPQKWPLSVMVASFLPSFCLRIVAIFSKAAIFCLVSYICPCWCLHDGDIYDMICPLHHQPFKGSLDSLSQGAKRTATSQPFPPNNLGALKKCCRWSKEEWRLGDNPETHF